MQPYGLSLSRPATSSSQLQLLTQADFAFAGAFKVPTNTGTISTGFSAAPLALRRSGGVNRLISSGYNGGTGYFPFYEMNIPALVISDDHNDYNVATTYKEWGGDWGILEAPNANPFILYGLFWDEVDQRLYESWGSYYTDQEEWPSLAYSTLDDDTDTITRIGNWIVDARSHKEVKSGVFRIPDSSFVSANCAGKPLAVGFGGGGYSIVNGHSMGPAFYAIAPPDVGAFPGGSTGDPLPCKELLSYPWNGTATASIPYRARRGNDYASEAFGPVSSATSNTLTIPNDIAPFDPGSESAMIGLDFTVKSPLGATQTRTCTGASGYTFTMNSNWTTIPDGTYRWSVPWEWTWPPVGETGYMTLGDIIYQSAVWVKTATGKQAIVVFVTLATGGQYYQHNPNHPNYEGTRHEIWLINPAELAAVANGSKANYTVDPYEKWSFEFPWVDYPLGYNTIQWSLGRQSVGGVTLTPEHDRMYVGYLDGYYTGGGEGRPIISAFDITP